MRILFLYPNVNLAPRINHGITALSAFLKKYGHTTALLQFNTRKSLRDLAKVSRFKPEIVGISTCSNQWEVAKFLAEQLKRKHGLKIFAGGAHPTVCPESLLETEAIDGICRGEGELAFLELVERISKGRSISDIPNFWIRQDGKIIKNEIRPLIENLDDLPLPDWSIFDRKAIYDYPCFNFSRGCPYSCQYCINSTLRSLYQGKGAYIRLKSPQSAILEIKDKLEKYKLRMLNFDDDVFVKDKNWISDFCSNYAKQIALPFNCNIRPENVDRETCAMLKQAGAETLGIGIESGDPEIRSRVLNRRMADTSIINAFKTARQAGLKTFSFNMIGIPGETPESFKKTVEINKNVLPDALQLSIFYPYPRTSLGELCRKEDYIKYNSGFGYFHRSILALPEFPRRQIHKYYDRFEYLVYKDTNAIKAFKFRLSKFIYRHPLVNLLFAPLAWGIRKIRLFKTKLPR